MVDQAASSSSTPIATSSVRDDSVVQAASNSQAGEERKANPPDVRASLKRSQGSRRSAKAARSSLELAEERREDERRKAGNKRKEKAIDKLLESDRALADLLLQTAGSLSALVTITSDSERALAAGSEVPEDQAQAAQDGLPASASSAERVTTFEERASQWFATLNDIQTSLRTATATLRADGRSALSDGQPLFGQGGRYAGRAEAGGAGRGHTVATQGAMSGQASYRSEKEAALSLGALRLQHQSWKQLNDALEEIAQGSSHKHSPPEMHADAADPVAANLDRRARKVTDDLREHQLTADARLIGALLGSSLLPNAGPTTTPDVE